MHWLCQLLKKCQYPKKASEVKVVNPEYPYGDIRRYGAVQGGVFDNADALENAILSGCATVRIPKGDWRIATDKTIIPMFDIRIIGDQGARLKFDHDATFKFQGQEIQFQKPVDKKNKVSVNASRGDKKVELLDTTGIQPHDVIFFLTTTEGEKAWHYPKNCVTTVLCVSGNEVILAHPLNFDFGASEAGNWVIVYRSDHRVTIENITLHVLSKKIGPLEFWGLKNVTLRDIVQENNVLTGNTVVFLRCVDCHVENSTIFNGTYPYNVSASRCISFDGLRAYGSRHVVTPAAWADTVYINNLCSRGGAGGVEAHPSFNIHYSNVDVIDTRGYSNMRCVGGSIRNAIIRYIYDPGCIPPKESKYNPISKTTLPLFHTVVLSDESIYEDYDFVVDGLLFDVDGKPFGPWKGRRFIIKNSELKGGLHPGTGNHPSHSIREAHVYNCIYDSFGGRSLRLLDTNNTVQHFELDKKQNVYVLNLLKGKVNYTEDRIYAQGDIFREINHQQDKKEVTIRVYDHWQEEGVGVVFGILKLKAQMNHANVGFFDILRHHYHFSHVMRAKSGFFFPPKPAFESVQNNDPDPQSPSHFNQTLKIDISNTSYEGASQQSDPRQYYFQLTVNISSMRGKPIYGLSYELELHR